MAGTAFTLKQLEALIWVADLGSFRRAAHHLNTTQPNISSRIASLEATLGVVLMRRDAGSVQMTDKGDQILAFARTMLRESEKIVETANRAELITDRLRLGVTELVACTWLHEYLRRLKNTYPNLSVELTVDLSRNLDKELAANALDLAIQSAPFSVPVTGVRPIGAYSYVWVGAPDLVAGLPPQLTIPDLLPLSLLTHARHTLTYIELSEFADAEGFSMAATVPSNSLTSCAQMARDGMGVAVIPEVIVTREIEAGHLTVLDVDWLPNPLEFAARFHEKRAAKFVSDAAEIAVKVAASQ